MFTCNAYVQSCDILICCVSYFSSFFLTLSAFQPVSLHPPSFTEYRSQTLPTRAKLKRLLSEAEKSATEPDSQTTNPDSSKPPPKRNPENTMLVKRGSMIFADVSAQTQTASDKQDTSRPQTPRVSTSSSEETDFTNTAVNDDSKGCTTPTTTPRSTPPMPTSKVSRSPSEIVASVMLNRKTSGGLRRTLTFYQENKKQVAKVQKTMHDGRIGMRPETQQLQADGRATTSAGKGSSSVMFSCLKMRLVRSECQC